MRALLTLVVAATVVVPTAASGATPPEAAGEEASTTVIVDLVDRADEGPGTRFLRAQEIDLAFDGVEVTSTLAGLGLATAEVTPAGLATLERSALVESVREPRELSFLLDASTGAIGADAVQAGGLTGAGSVVAVIDSGVDVNHPGLVGSVVAEACFLTGIAAGDELCRNRPDLTAAIGPGSAVPCTLLPDDCTHGTHIAGLVSGDDETLTGVAPDAGIFAIRVGAVVDGSNTIPELGVLQALDHVHAMRDTYDIAAVNLSLGGSPGLCIDPAWEEIVGRLADAGIAVVAASGNDGSQSSITFPACLPGVVSVGATSGDGEVAGFSQTSELLDLLAPGVGIESTVLASFDPSGFAELDGTSFAAPHVTAAFALVRGSQPGFTVDRMRQLMRTTGHYITRVTPPTWDRDPRYPELRLEPVVAFEPFSDADDGFWVAASDWARFTGVSTGPGGGIFDPDPELTRAEAVTFLWRFMGEPVASGPSGFTDVADDTWYVAAVDWAAEAGVTTGLAPGIFGPDDTVTRGQVATLMWRTAGEPAAMGPAGFTDVATGSFYEAAVDWMAEHAITVGTTATTFSPEDMVDRAQMVTFTHRLADADRAWTGAVMPPALALF